MAQTELLFTQFFVYKFTWVHGMVGQAIAIHLSDVLLQVNLVKKYVNCIHSISKNFGTVFVN